MKQLASLFMHSRTQAHVFHLRVKGAGSLAAHLALQTYYEGIIPLLDLLIENYQGKNGLIVHGFQKYRYTWVDLKHSFYRFHFHSLQNFAPFFLWRREGMRLT